MKHALTALLVSASLLSACTSDKKTIDSTLQNRSERELFKSQDGTTAPDFQHVFQQLIPDFNTTMLSCPERIWPAYDWKDYNVLMLDQGHPPLLWTGSSGTASTVLDSDFPEENYQGTYNFFDWKGQPAVSIFPNFNNEGVHFPKNELFLLTVHEGFHHHGQKDWVRKPGARGTEYPLDPLPRIYRRHIFDRLYAHFLSNGNDKTALAQAAFWFRKWSSEYTDEAVNTTDGYEGTARYVEYMAHVLSLKSCSVSDTELYTDLKAFLPTQQYANLTPETELDGEGYTLGSLAAFTLRLIDHNSKWYDEAKAGHTPLEVLLRDVPPAADVVNAQIDSEFRQITEKKNKDLEAMFGKDLISYKDKNYARIVLMGAVASFSPKGFYLPKTLPQVTLIPLAAELPLQVSSTETLVIKADTNLFSQDSPCAKKGFFVALLPKSEVQIKDGQLQLNSSGLVGKYPTTELIDDSGTTWYCPQ